MSANSYGYWPWWLGGAALAFTAIGFPLLVNAPLGVSGALGRLLRWRSDRPGAAPTQDPAGTTCGGGPTPVSSSPTSTNLNPSTLAPVPGGDCCGGSLPPAAPGAPAITGPDRTANLAFLLAMLVGGAIAGWVGGQTWTTARLSPEFHRLLGSGSLQTLTVLFGGGVLVGLGTRLSGGCTSGHGLSGCGRLQPASLVATAVFFGVAIAVSFLLERFSS